MNRIDFFDSISGIQYPEMIINFFDQFIALKTIVEDSGTVTVLNSTDKYIEFTISFKNEELMNIAYSTLMSLNGFIVIYGKSIKINTEIYNPCCIKIILG